MTIGETNNLKKLFDQLKEKGLFQGYESYSEWCEKKLGEKPKKKKEQPKLIK